MLNERPGKRPDMADDSHHLTDVMEKGPFAVARCTCGWKGPARRARDRARRDALSHTP